MSTILTHSFKANRKGLDDNKHALLSFLVNLMLNKEIYYYSSPRGLEFGVHSFYAVVVQ